MAYPRQENSQQESPMECPICMDEVPKGSGSICPAYQCVNKKFHTHCLNQWLSRDRRCPLCRGIPLVLAPPPSAPPLPPMQQIMPSQYRLGTPSFIRQIQDQQQRVLRTGPYTPPMQGAATWVEHWKAFIEHFFPPAYGMEAPINVMVANAWGNNGYVFSIMIPQFLFNRSSDMREIQRDLESKFSSQMTPNMYGYSMDLTLNLQIRNRAELESSLRELDEYFSNKFVNYTFAININLGLPPQFNFMTRSLFNVFNYFQDPMNYHIRTSPFYEYGFSS